MPKIALVGLMVLGSLPNLCYVSREVASSRDDHYVEFSVLKFGLHLQSKQEPQTT